MLNIAKSKPHETEKKMQLKMLDPHCHTPTLNPGWRGSSPHKLCANAVLHVCNRQRVLHFIFRHRYCRPGVEYQLTILQTSNQTTSPACPRRQPIKDSEAATGKSKQAATHKQTQPTQASGASRKPATRPWSRPSPHERAQAQKQPNKQYKR